MNDLATQYYKKVCELEKLLNGALRRISNLEEAVIEKDRIIVIQASRIEELEEEVRRLKGTGKKLKRIIF
jgi:hypothetical protein